MLPCLDASPVWYLDNTLDEIVALCNTVKWKIIGKDLFGKIGELINLPKLVVTK